MNAADMRTHLPDAVRAFAARNLRWIVAGAAVALLALLAVSPLLFVDPVAFYSRYQDLSQNAGSLGTSSHRGVACSGCHVDRRGTLVRDAALVGDFYASIVGGRKLPLFSRFDKPANQACLACHLNEWSDDAKRTARVPHPAHLRVAYETRPCVGCHKWTAHEETAMQKHKEMPFSGVCVSYGCHVGYKAASDCANCHHSLDTADWKLDHPRIVQTAGANGCLEVCHQITQCRGCHTTGKVPQNVTGPKVEAGLQQIQTSHVRPDWLQLHGTLAMTDRSLCLKCHVSDSECKACHARRPAFHGSDPTVWIGTHKDVAKKDPRRCLECHQKSWCDACHKQFKEMR